MRQQPPDAELIWPEEGPPEDPNNQYGDMLDECDHKGRLPVAIWSQGRLRLKPGRDNRCVNLYATGSEEAEPYWVMNSMRGFRARQVYRGGYTAMVDDYDPKWRFVCSLVPGDYHFGELPNGLHVLWLDDYHRPAPKLEEPTDEPEIAAAFKALTKAAAEVPLPLHRQPRKPSVRRRPLPAPPVRHDSPEVPVPVGGNHQPTQPPPSVAVSGVWPRRLLQKPVGRSVRPLHWHSAVSADGR